jgi:hypothetical protein
MKEGRKEESEEVIRGKKGTKKGERKKQMKFPVQRSTVDHTLTYTNPTTMRAMWK